MWKIKSEEYKNKKLKQECYKLVDKLGKIIWLQTGIWWERINAVWTNYTRELKKVRNSEKSGAGSDDIYGPALWYFDDLELLKDQETQHGGEIISMVSKEEKSMGKSLDYLVSENHFLLLSYMHLCHKFLL